MEAIVLAGGLGTRLRAAVPDVPKPMAPVNGRPFLEYLLDYWIGQGISRFVVAVGYRHELITRHFGNAYRNIPITYAAEDPPLGTGGGLLNAAQELAEQGPVLVLNGDTYFGVALQPMLEFHRLRNAAITMALFEATEPGRYHCVETDRNDRVTNFVESGGRKNYAANGGVYVFSDLPGLQSRWTPGVPLSLESDVLPAEIENKAAVFGFESGAGFIDIGIPQDYARAAQILSGK